jgi:hypothetical protein
MLLFLLACCDDVVIFALLWNRYHSSLTVLVMYCNIRLKDNSFFLRAVFVVSRGNKARTLACWGW